MSFRRLFVLASNLPDDSPLRRKILGPDEYQWNAEMRMLASIHEQVQWLGWAMGELSKHKFKGKKNPFPEPQIIPRPGVSPAEVDKKAKRQAKPGGLVFGAKGKSAEESEYNQRVLRGFFGRDGKKTGR
jgi:hypothetical protein